MGEAKRRAGTPPRPKVEVNYDCHPDIKDQGATYFHCVQCMEERPDGISPAQWARQQMAITETGHFQLRCTRHNINIALITFKVKGADFDG